MRGEGFYTKNRTGFLWAFYALARNEEWDTPEYHDTTDTGKKKEEKIFTLYRIETEDICKRYDAPCFVNGLEAYDGEINLEHDKNLISNEFAVNLCLEHECIINPKEDDIEPGVVLGRSFVRLTKEIADFGNGIITIYLDLDPFNDDPDKANDSEDDWDVILEGIYFGDIPKINRLELLPYVCNIGKSSKDKKKPHGNYKMTQEALKRHILKNLDLTRTSQICRTKVSQKK
nr:hypothetical protein [Tanacetum cinerariifolium]